MIATCGNCEKKLKLSKKVEEGVMGLEPGTSIKVKCPECGEAMLLDSSLKNIAAVSTDSVTPPAPPDISWLKEGIFDDDEVVEDIPQALIVMKDLPGRDVIIKGVESLGYRAELATSPQSAIEKMRFVDYASVMMHSRFEGKNIRGSSFHRFMSEMHMSKRRYIFYILIGPEFNTFYDLQALAFSANLVVNDKELEKFDVILRKAIPSYEMLFGPIMEELRLQGK